jgi:V8-like Glu-specific endopeptidase
VPAALFTSQPDDSGHDAQAVANRLALDARDTGCTTRPHAPTTPDRCSSVTTAAVKTPSRSAADASGGSYRADGAVSVGQMWSKDGGCTATVVTSTSGNVAVTAAHCVYRPTLGPLARNDRTHGWIYDQFIPGRTGDLTPYGSWTIDTAWIDPCWRDTGDPTYDIAFLHLAHRDGRSIQDVVGSQGISFTPPAAGTRATVLGYPAQAPFDGQTLRRCSTGAVTVEPAVWNMLAMACAMAEGSSGGPWLTGFDLATGAGNVVAVSSVHENDGPRLFARPLGEIGYNLYRSADH